MSKWSAIVYSATRELDFGLLAVPENFTKQDKEWVEDYRLAITRDPEKLKYNPLWSIFKNKDYCVIGLTCRVEYLMSATGDPNSNLLDINLDDHSRPNYAFLGYVYRFSTSDDYQLTYIPNFYENLALFKQLSQYISEKWGEKQKGEPKILPYMYFGDNDDNFESADSKDEFLFFKPFGFTCNFSEIQKHSVLLFPNDEHNRKQLWSFVSKYILFCPQDISLYIGENNRNNILESPFLIATTNGIDSYRKEDRTTTVPPNKQPSSLYLRIKGSWSTNKSEYSQRLVAGIIVVMIATAIFFVPISLTYPWAKIIKVVILVIGLVVYIQLNFPNSHK